MKQYLSEDLPYYDNPPVTEVVFGLMFEPLKKLLVPHVGIFWEKFRADYPECSEVAPLLPVIELPEGQVPQSVEFGEIPPMPRIWFTDRSGSTVIQVQRDRFHFNWRKRDAGEEYPRYKNLVIIFGERLDQFEAFLNENDFGEVAPIQYELTYVNSIMKGEGWGGLAKIEETFPDYAWKKTDRKKLLKAPEAIHFRSAFLMANGLGRLHVTIRNAKQPDNRELVFMELTARGMPADASRESMWNWFSIARQWIVQGFTDLTDDHIQERIWRRRQ